MNDFECAEKERKLRILAKEKINKIERLKKEVKNDEVELLDGKTKILNY